MPGRAGSFSQPCLRGAGSLYPAMQVGRQLSIFQIVTLALRCVRR